MILSETNWRYKKPIEVVTIKPLKNREHTTGIAYRSSVIRASSKFLTATLCEYKAIAIVALLLVFQFSLYDFNVDEYVSSNPHGVAQDAQIMESTQFSA
jgi:hypothetical protein